MASKIPKLPINGHTAGIYADMSVDGPPIGTLVAVIDRAKNLPNRKTMGKQNPYCAARLGKEAKKTETDMRGGQTPRWDQELRFTARESPDYYQLKVSVFNDDKKTDMIGETWVDLKNVVIPGGGQSDQWHQLQFKGKYAGEVRIEMTYYDTRPEDETVIERRKATEKIQAKTASPSPASSSLSGPREPKPVKRRPLPTDPTGSSAARPSAPEHVQSGSGFTHSSPAPRPVMHEHAHSAPPRPVPSEYARPTSRHSAMPEPLFSTPPHGSSPATRLSRGYDTPDDFQREWVPVNGRQGANNSPSYPQERRQSYREQPTEQYDPRFQSTQPQSGYENAYQPDQRRQRQEMADDPYDRPPEPEAMYPRRYETPPRQSSYPVVPLDQPRYAELPSYGQRSIKPAQPAVNVYDSPPPDFAYSRSAPGSSEPGGRYRRNDTSPTKSDVFRDSPLRKSMSREDYHPEYASMQPRVEDEEDEGPPPPPPVHRSKFVQTGQQAEAPPTTYRAYSPGYIRSASPSTDFDLATSAISLSSQTSYSSPGKGRLQELPSHANVQGVPPSLVAGYDPAIAEAESDRAIYEGRANRRHSDLHLPRVPVSQAPDQSQYEPPVYPQQSASVAAAERAGSYADVKVSKPRSVSPDTRGILQRKSVSPRPPPAEERGLSGVPFSPDSYDALNPHTRSSIIKASAAPYGTPEQATEAAKRAETDKARDLEPIIGDDGRIIDPSDHLPTDTWAPEPERKTRKPEVVIRFKHSPQVPTASRSSRDTVAARPQSKPQIIEVGSSYSAERIGRNRLHKQRPQSYVQSSPNAVVRASPRGDNALRERENYGGYGHHRNYSTPNAYESPQARRKSTSPSPASKFYDPSNAGPPIPAKVPVAQPMNQSYPIMGASPSMDALSQEIQSIDIGSVGRGSGRDVRKYAPRTSTVGAGYAM